MASSKVLSIAFSAAVTAAAALDQCDVPGPSRQDCGYAGVDQHDCEQKGCCWSPADANGLPWCFKTAGHVQDDNCFVSLAQMLPEPPIDDAAIQLMAQHFMGNINVNGSGAVIASPGDVPALPSGDTHGFYAFHWTRDAALSLTALQRLAADGQFGISEQYLTESMEAYIKWIRKIESEAGVDAHTEPKWDIKTGHPYEGGWCRPQSDGAGLRAQNLIRYAMKSEQSEKLWSLIKFDLDWISQEGIHLKSCDLWEEGTDEANLLWNRVTQQAALIMGADFAKSLGHSTESDQYLKAAVNVLGDTFAQHQSSDGWFTECPIADPSSNCQSSGKVLDSVVFLSLIHTAWLSDDTRVPGSVKRAPTSVAVAKTVEHYNSAFCGAYPINRQDSAAGKPGVLYGRYAADEYGGGNPWVLLTATLASALYQAAQYVAHGNALGDDESAAWKAALRAESVTKAADFVAAGDAVLLRIKEHVSEADNWHLYEQMFKANGTQYNAKDLTWSYAEVLSALLERKSAKDVMVLSNTPFVV